MSQTPLERLEVLPVPAFQDNYLWLLRRGPAAVAIDPGDAPPIERALEKFGLELSAIVLTHHHRDHMGGVAELVARRSARQLPVYGPAAESIAGVTHPLKGGDQITLESVQVSFDVLDVPGHTLGHIAYISRDLPTPLLFCGDTLFGCGCGRLFEGTPTQMQASLARLAALPGNTLAFCAHEYTLANIRFALAVDPDNPALQERARRDAARRQEQEPTVPFTIALEKATNPFLRWEDSAVRAAAEARVAGAAQSPVATFAAIRAWKDKF